MSRVLVIGGTGFHGSHILRALVAAPQWDQVWSASRSAATLPGTSGGLRVDLSAGDDVLAEVVQGFDVVVNAAHLVTGDEPELDHVNRRGVGALARACRTRGSRFIEIGTAAVYGRGPFEGAGEGDLPVRPESPTSASRALGEQEVLAAGGIVVRPHLVVGEGDRWVVLTAAAALAHHDGSPLPGRLSVLNVADLAQLVAALTALDEPPQLLHASVPGGVATAELADLCRSLRLPAPQASGHSAAPGFLGKALHLGSDLAWSCTGLPAPTATTLLRPADVQWYRRRHAAGPAEGLRSPSPADDDGGPAAP